MESRQWAEIPPAPPTTNEDNILMTKEKKIVRLYENDPRCQALLDSLADVLYERGSGLPLPSTLGVLRLLEYEIIENAKSD